MQRKSQSNYKKNNPTHETRTYVLQKTTLRGRHKNSIWFYDLSANNTVTSKTSKPSSKQTLKKAKRLREEFPDIPPKKYKTYSGVTDDTLLNSVCCEDEMHEITRKPQKQKENTKQKYTEKNKDNLTQLESTINPAENAALPSAMPANKNVGPLMAKARHEINKNSKLPPISLLETPTMANYEQYDTNTQSRKLENVLKCFGINATVTDVLIGPSVTRFEVQPELGTRVSKITSLADDLKLNLAVTEMRIEAPVPGKSVVGIEIPNKTKQSVRLKELIDSNVMRKQKSKIAFAAGKDISGEIVACDLAKMPHMLIAGTTGSGKSVFLNSILMCMLYRSTPEEVGLIIIDPKKVEFSVYSGIPHLMKDIVTEPQKAVAILRWAVQEMTDRYKRMQEAGVRDFATYNEKFDSDVLDENAKRMKQIVIIIDELADLMMVAAKEVESLICRLAQLARAAGIHLLIATQRPSVDVVTGLIKANIPARAALLVASGVDSRTIIDTIGAEKLLGNGDMLFYPTGYVKPVRLQGAFVSDDEIYDTVQWLKEHTPKDYVSENDEIETYINEHSEEENSAEEKPQYDELLEDAGYTCIDSNRASSSMLQRKYSIGFNRAARIIDQLYEIGAVGPQNGSKPREILVNREEFFAIYSKMAKN